MSLTALFASHSFANSANSEAKTVKADKEYVSMATDFTGVNAYDYVVTATDSCNAYSYSVAGACEVSKYINTFEKEGFKYRWDILQLAGLHYNFKSSYDDLNMRDSYRIPKITKGFIPNLFKPGLRC